MKICNLASGSEGNVTYIETGNHKILFDLGTTVKYIKDKLSELSVSIEDIDYVLITHVHDDHIKALKNFIKKYKPTICVSPLMFSELEDLKYYDKVILYDERKMKKSNLSQFTNILCQMWAKKGNELYILI